MTFYDRQILSGLEKVPTPNSPGTLVVTGNAQAVFSPYNPGDTTMAACEYGKKTYFSFESLIGFLIHFSVFRSY